MASQAKYSTRWAPNPDLKAGGRLKHEGGVGICQGLPFCITPYYILLSLIIRFLSAVLFFLNIWSLQRFCKCESMHVWVYLGLRLLQDLSLHFYSMTLYSPNTLINHSLPNFSPLLLRMSRFPNGNDPGGSF